MQRRRDIRITNNFKNRLDREAKSLSICISINQVTLSQKQLTQINENKSSNELCKLIDKKSEHYVYFQRGAVLRNLSEFHSLKRVAKAYWKLLKNVIIFFNQRTKALNLPLVRVNGNKILEIAKQLYSVNQSEQIMQRKKSFKIRSDENFFQNQNSANLNLKIGQN